MEETPQNLLEEKRESHKTFSILIGSTLIAAALFVGCVLIAGVLWLKLSPKNPVTQVSTEQPLFTTQAPFIPENAPIMGDTNAPVTMVIYTDYQCPFCKQYFDNVFPQLKKDYVDTGKLKVIHVDFAFLGNESISSAEAAYCAKEQNKFWEFHDLLYKNQKSENSGNFNNTLFLKLATDLNLDMPSFGQCINTRKYKEQVSSDFSGSEKIGIVSTPSIIIKDQKFEGVGSYEIFKNKIDSYLGK